MYQKELQSKEALAIHRRSLDLAHNVGNIGNPLEQVSLVMELAENYSENLLEGLSNAIRLLALCRTTEIDLREMRSEDNLPEPISIANGVLI